MWKKDCLPKGELRRGAWTEHDDKLLSDYIESHGLGIWRSLPAKAGNENANKRENEGSVTSMVKSKIIKCANDLPTYETEYLNKNNSFSHEEHLTMKLQGHEQVCLPDSASSDFGFGLELSFGELSNSSVFSDYEWKDVKSIASPSVIGDVFNSKRMERNEEMHPFIAEVEWESLIKSCEAI
ncbi:Transcription factor MYB3 [Dendrobium catenatum]|uniref:Transcription factor MYB3 n=1 Tax=Dendrobium catenatum TaxID=906689 RepID=A0A2I0VW13_9ASPA|nr:Transcription factor MYB3 [Dendrobium catenatum]